MTDFPQGSTWRKWDLQVQTIIDDAYVSLDTYYSDLKAAEPIKWKALCDRIGSEELVLKYDSKSYFTSDAIDDEKARAHNYARVFVAFLEIFGDEEERVISITDHNYYNDHLIDALLKESKGSVVTILPGVEINVQGVHQLVIFNEKAYEKTSYSETIKHFLSQIGIHNAKTGGTLSVSSASYENVVQEVEKCGGLIIYAHCNSSNGLFQERGKTDRTHLADQFNFQEFNILQSKAKASADVTTEYIGRATTLKSPHVFTLGTDARCLKDILQPDSDGNFCWIKADPTFYGLQQICFEPETRVFLGETPRILELVETEPTRFIHSFSINQVAGYDEARGVWFKDIEMPINPEMVAIIGNKGSGKSALADILGLVGESKNMAAASFLVQKRFKKPGLAKNFEASISWQSGDVDTKNLYDDVDETHVEKVKYLPQSWFEELTNDLDGKQFSKELEKVVYTHLDDAERLGHESFEDLIDYRTASVNEDIVELKSDLHDVNVEAFRYLQKLHPDYAKEIQSSLDQKRRELEAHLKLEPEKVENPDKGDEEEKATATIMQQIQTLDETAESLNDQLRVSAEEQVVIARKKHNITSLSEDLSRTNRSLEDLLGSQKVLEIFGEQANQVASLTINEKLIKKTEQELDAAMEVELQKVMSEQDILELGLETKEQDELLGKSIQVQLDRTEKARDELKAKLEKPQELYQKYLEAYKLWSDRKAGIEGAKDDPAKGTINYFIHEQENIQTVYPVRLGEERDKQKELSAQIFQKKKDAVAIYEAVKSKVDAVIEKNKPKVDDYSINVEAGLALSADFRDEVLERLNLRAKGSFMVRETGFNLLGRIIDDKDPNIATAIEEIQTEINQDLETDNRTEIREDDKKRYVMDQVNDVVGFYDYLYGLDYLNENYQLRLDNKNLESLSPGEKGALLLVFYLMLDQDNIPLIIDQPEDNLDNQSVSKILVEFIKGAKARRQIILVTHNPNLAVVADAEQIIYTELDKTKNHTFSAVSGAIEDEEMNTHIVDVLEGTMPAFDKRRLRYTRAKKEV